MKTRPKDGDRVDFSKQVEVPAPIGYSATKKWQPSEGETHTVIYGKGTATPSPSLQEMAALDVQQYYPYLVKDSPEYKRRIEEFLTKYTEV